MSFEIKPNRVDSQEEIVALIATNLPNAASTTMGIVFGSTINDNKSNTALGFRTLESNTDGISNTAIGNQSLIGNSTGNENTGVGIRALVNNNGSENVAVGADSLRDNYTGSRNTAVGDASLGSNTSGNNNTAVGKNAGSQMQTGFNNTMLGNAAQASSPSVSHEITLGNSSIETLRAQVTSITSLSDIRDKKNIESLPTGLDFVNSLNPVKFDWNMRDGGKVNVSDTGFIAQELIEIEDKSGIADYLKLTYRENPEKLEASYGRLIPVIVKAIQDLSKEVENLKNKN